MNEMVRAARLLAKVIRQSQRPEVLVQSISCRQLRRLVIAELARS